MCYEECRGCQSCLADLAMDILEDLYWVDEESEWDHEEYNEEPWESFEGVN